MHQIGQLLHNTLVGAEILILRQHHAEIEDELIPVVSQGLHADRITQNAVAIGADLDQVPTQLLPGNNEEGDVGESEEEGLRGGSCGGDNRAIGDLVDDLGP